MGLRGVFRAHAPGLEQQVPLQVEQASAHCGGGSPQVVLPNEGHASGQVEVITPGDRHARAAAVVILIRVTAPERMGLQLCRTAVVLRLSFATPALGRRRACRVGGILAVDQLPRPGAIGHALRTVQEPAGGGAVVAVQMARLQRQPVQFFTALGRDSVGEACVKRLEHLGLEVHVAWREEPTRRGVSLVDGSGVIPCFPKVPSVGGGGEDAQRMRSRSKVADCFPGCK